MTRTKLPSLSSSSASLIVIATTLAISFFFKNRDGWVSFTEFTGIQMTVRNPYYYLCRYAWSIGVDGLTNFLIPFTYLTFFYRNPTESIGFKWHIRRNEPTLFLGLLGLTVFFTFLASLSPSLSSQYPLYSDAGRSWIDLILYEALLGFQVFFQEYFFRCFILMVLIAEFESYGVIASAVPYCLLHLGKTPPEIVVSFFFGILLSLLAHRTRSIIPCFLLHWTQVLTLEMSAFFQNHSVSTLKFWP